MGIMQLNYMYMVNNEQYDELLIISVGRQNIGESILVISGDTEGLHNRVEQELDDWCRNNDHQVSEYVGQIILN